jgi:hypothetical protein
MRPAQEGKGIMTARSFGIIIWECGGGLLVGFAVATMTSWSTWPGMLLAGGVMGLAIGAVLYLYLPGGGKGPLKGQEGAPHDDNPH